MTHLIPFTILVTGHILCEIDIADSRLHMIIDTGASNTLVSRETADRLGLKLSVTEETATGAGGSDLEMHLAEGLSMSYDGSMLYDELTVAVLDISNIRDAVIQMDGIEIDGVLGADIFMSMSAIIDYDRQLLVLHSDR